MTPTDIWSAESRQKLTAALIEHAPTGPLAEAHLHAAISGTVSRPGKLVRARLVFSTTTAHGIDEETGLTLATAVEYFHLASLLLDDLPCMDDAVTRRGFPCVHQSHGEATAILTALALINRAYALVGFALATQPGAVRIQAQACLDACLGSAGLVGGQARDLRFAASDRSAREVSCIALGKTGAMLWLGLLFPALLVDPCAVERRALEALCVYWSLALQALDDVQDLFATSVAAGKTTGRDRALSRPNLAVTLGVPAAQNRINRLLSQAEKKLGLLISHRPVWNYLEQFQRYFAEAAAPIAGKTAVVAA
ncbi:MAG TPA: polyprenyl synthetase family protein [Opitutus sp.]|nr:polyprenyl synthetase family protein [Opitutus sp.]